MLVRDQNDDVLGVDLYRLASLNEVPAYVKQADASALRGDRDVPAHCYADPLHRRFPVHTAAATWTSAAYFADKEASLLVFDSHVPSDLIRERIEKAAKFWGNHGDVAAVMDKVAASKRASDDDLPDDYFAVVYEGASGKERHLRLANAGEVKAAAAWLKDYRTEFAYKDRVTIANKVLAKAAEFGADLGEDGEVVDRCAGYGTCSTAAASTMLRMRAKFAAADERDRVEKLVVEFEQNPSKLRDRATRMKLAAAVDEFDRAQLLRYKGGLTPPEDVLFALTGKTASRLAAGLVRTATGSVYDLGAVATLKTAAVRDHLGDGVNPMEGYLDRLDRVKLATALPALSHADATLFDRAASEQGVTPVVREPSGRPRVSLASAAAAFGGQG